MKLENKETDLISDLFVNSTQLKYNSQAVLLSGRDLSATDIASIHIFYDDDGSRRSIQITNSNRHGYAVWTRASDSWFCNQEFNVNASIVKLAIELVGFWNLKEDKYE